MSQVNGDMLGLLLWPKGGYWILSRELVLFQYIDLSNVPPKLRTKVVNQKAAQISPFKDAGILCHIEKTSGYIWLWDESIRLEALASISDVSLQQEAKELTILPETLLMDQKDAGCWVQACVEGMEYQYWDRNKLVHSQWVVEDSNVSRVAFLRSIGLRECDESFSTSDSFSALPWNQQPISVKDFLQETIALPMVAALLCLVLLFQLSSLMGWRYELYEMQSNIDILNKNLVQTLQLRKHALDLKRENKLLVSWFDKPGQLTLMSEFDRALRSESLEIQEWKYQQNELRVKLFDLDIDNRAIVEDLSKSDVFSNVRVEPGLLTGVVTVIAKVAG